jgi:hypothetical protein
LTMPLYAAETLCGEGAESGARGNKSSNGAC